MENIQNILMLRLLKVAHEYAYNDSKQGIPQDESFQDFLDHIHDPICMPI